MPQAQTAERTGPFVRFLQMKNHFLGFGQRCRTITCVLELSFKETGKTCKALIELYTKNRTSAETQTSLLRE